MARRLRELVEARSREELVSATPDPQELLQLLDELLDAAAQADALLARWKEASGPRQSDARDGLKIRVRLAELEHQLADVVCFPSDENTRQRSQLIVAFYEHLLKQAVDAQFSHLPNSAFTIRRDDTREGGYGELVQMRDELRTSIFGVRAYPGIGPIGAR
ncbi:MAG: hypothetical protein ACTHMF_12350 [Leifsonia sp.]|uniref:hypothetical protein n=1 Tax=Leifsonia sp. TaxID=1870902 RepID=UPI003F7DF48E